jgi:hypothetical protein
VTAVQSTRIWLVDSAVAVTPLGTPGAVVSASVVAEAAGVDSPETFGGVAVSKARTW